MRIETRGPQQPDALPIRLQFQFPRIPFVEYLTKHRSNTGHSRSDCIQEGAHRQFVLRVAAQDVSNLVSQQEGKLVTIAVTKVEQRFRHKYKSPRQRKCVDHRSGNDRKPEFTPGIFHRVTNNITEGGTTDTYQVSFHGQTVAHIDTWCHFFENGTMYNGVPVKDNVSAEAGCIKGSVMNWKDGITTRAVLYDIAQLKGADWVDPNTPIMRADLEAWEKKSGVKAGPGDIPLLYIGRWKRRAALGPWTGQVAGYYADTIPWMHERLPAFIGHDFNIDWNPRPGWEGLRNPIHVAVLNWMGINIIECLDLEQAAATARRLNRYEFLITFAPLPVEGGTGSPVNPLAIF